MDTVGLDGMGERGLQPVVRDGRLYGRGACDTKGSLAAMLGAIGALRERRHDLRLNVQLLAAVDEEYRYRGVLRYLDGGGRPAAAIVGEPSGLRLVVAHKGCLRTRISTVGRAAHSSRPEDGVNAIDAMTGILTALGHLRRRLAGRRHALAGGASMSVGRIWGGTAVNVVPDRCTIEVDRRLIPGEVAEDALAEIDAALEAARRADPELRIEREDPFVADWALDTPPDAAVVRAGMAACRDEGLPADPVGVSFGSDASKLWALGHVPSVVLGPGDIAQAHTADEFVPLEDLTRAAALYVRTALHLGSLLGG
jgi:acetylornithine deacetylase